MNFCCAFLIPVLSRNTPVFQTEHMMYFHHFTLFTLSSALQYFLSPLKSKRFKSEIKSICISVMDMMIFFFFFKYV